VAYGECKDELTEWMGPPIPGPRAGEVCKRVLINDLLIDSDSASDWCPFREYRYGYTEVGRKSFWVPAGGVCAYTSPDCSLDVILSAVDRTESSIRLCSYEFSSPELTEALLRAIRRGVAVTLLIDGMPAGGMTDDEISCLSALSGCGASVMEIRGSVEEDIVQHIGPMHAKYAVFDLRESIIQSENFVSSGVPADRIFGNRGWGVLVRSAQVAKFLADLFDDDSRRERRDVQDWSSDPRLNSSSSLPPLTCSEHPDGMLKPHRSVVDARIDLYVSPDSSQLAPFLEGLLLQSRQTSIQQFQVDMAWKSRWSGEASLNPLLRAVLTTLSHGGNTRFLLDSSWFNYERNLEVLECMRSSLASQGLRGEVQLLDNRSPVAVLHNKGAIMDGRLVLVSSNNWVSSSFSRNRELAALIDSEELASYFQGAFDLDWFPDVEEPVADAGPDLKAELGETVSISGKMSGDDRLIASWSWDIYGDGDVDGTGQAIDFTPASGGRVVVRLIVEDAWGNIATDEMIVTVEPQMSGSGEGRPRLLSRFGWAIPLALGAAAFLARLAVRRRSAED
jgi:hypothetical protein